MIKCALFTVIALISFVFTAYERPTPEYKGNNIGLSLPLPAELFLLFGDRYLAANVNYLRAASSSYGVEANAVASGELQLRVSLLNPKHEDNYYIAAAGFAVSFDGSLGQTVLARAAQARYWDPMPYFFQGMNEFFVNKDYLQTAQYVAKAAEVSTGPNKEFFTEVASRFFSLSENIPVSIAYIELLMANTKSEPMKALLLARLNRLKILQRLRAAAKQYTEANGLTLRSLKQLVTAGILQSLPQDPLKIGYGVDASGIPILLRRHKK